jgi:hypothetical protein
MKYEILEFRNIPLDRLDAHPAAEAFKRGSEDQMTLNESVRDLEVVTPLHVVAREDLPGRWHVVDGVTRLLALEASGAAQAPCLVVACDDVETLVLAVNCERRRVTTGTRVLSYLLRHQELVLAADDYYGAGRVAGTDDGSGRTARRSVGHVTHRAEELAKWTDLAVSERLGCSRKDVAAAVELLRCHERRRIPEICQGGVVFKERAADDADDADRERIETVRACLRNVLGGVMPVRRWRAGFAGRVTTAGGRDETDFAALGVRAMTSMITVFNAWSKVDAESKGDLLRKFEAVQKAFQKNVLSEM